MTTKICIAQNFQIMLTIYSFRLPYYAYSHRHYNSKNQTCVALRNIYNIKFPIQISI
jgi:hypothetical protein